jgi:hypothetical protein
MSGTTTPNTLTLTEFITAIAAQIGNDEFITIENALSVASAAQTAASAAETQAQSFAAVATLAAAQAAAYVSETSSISLHGYIVLENMGTNVGTLPLGGTLDATGSGTFALSGTTAEFNAGNGTGGGTTVSGVDFVIGTQSLAGTVNLASMFSYVDGTLSVTGTGAGGTVTSSNGGGGGVPALPFSVSSFTDISGVTLVSASNSIIMNTPPEGSGSSSQPNCTWAFLPLSSFPLPFAVQALLDWPAYNFVGVGIGLRDTTSGYFLIMLCNYNTYVGHVATYTVRMDLWTSPNADTSNPINIQCGSRIKNFRIRDDGTNYYFEYALDGGNPNWILAYSCTHTALLPNAATEVGVFFQNWDNAGVGLEISAIISSVH